MKLLCLLLGHKWGEPVLKLTEPYSHQCLRCGSTQYLAP